MFILTILCHVQVIHLLFNRAEAKDSIHELNAAEQMKENMKLKDQMMAKDVEISLLKESLIENGMTLTIFKIVFCHQFQKLEGTRLLQPTFINNAMSLTFLWSPSF